MTPGGQTIWIIGASEGLGAALARKLHRRGARLILSARGAEKLDALAAELPGARALPLDVTDDASLAAAWERTGLIDQVVYNAGTYDPMRAQEWDAPSVLRMADTNFTGALRVLGHVLPYFVARGAGRITLVGSLAGFRGLPGAIGYGASKSALMHLAENLHVDLAGTGVSVRLANPGFIRTRLTDKNDFAMPQIMTPEAAADHVLRAMTGRRFSTSFPRPFAWLFRIFSILPDAIYFRIMGRSN
ncbi:Short-chain dehydrogenase [Salinihabitans flavidus]|uniref:Short-chain dehydrogenase n=1 Tax=Salinihabitans flavidus TaxID=569882 RepID=A0A1H8MPX4_9RHOB|nr:SDR family NAD(P)-dependent oxidoreductase [Salinihabitans flavidus]SEO19293.1 Short-chain dehydrogenase [Salinihabitans flavidus]